MKKVIFTAFISLFIAITVYAGDGTRFLHQPDITGDQIAFVYGRNLWTVPIQGGVAKQLTSHVGSENSPSFSPDGRMIAFSGQYDGNMDVYVISADGGEPKRLTYHPGVDQVLGWTPDGTKILFSSNRYSYSRFTRIFAIDHKGGFPEALPMPEASQGSLSPNGSQIAYTPITNAFDYWKRYRGGRTTPLWIFDLKDNSYSEIPYVESKVIDLEKEIMVRCNDHNPVWIGDTVYFLSDRNEVMDLFAYNTNTKQLNKLFDHGKIDIKNLSGSKGKLIYECEGYIYVYDIEKGKAERLTANVSVEQKEIRPRYKNVAGEIRSATISPSGARVVFEARGELLTVPAKKGDIRNISQSSGSNDRNPAWSPDGKSIAYFSDMGGEYALYVIDQFARKAPKKYSLKSPTFFYNPVWSPDSKKIAFSDNKLNLWQIDLETEEQNLVDDSITARSYSWSPDSKWIAYMFEIESGFQIISLYSLETGSKHRITDGMSDARNPVFDKEGKYLYFLASTNAGKAKTLGADMSTNDARNEITWNIYIALLQKDLSSPFLPESDEEEVKSATEEKKPEEKKPEENKAPKEKTKDIKIDIDEISDRILTLPLPAKNQYGQLQTAGGDKIFFLDDSSIRTFSLKSRKADDFLGGVQSFVVSADGTKILYRSGPNWGVIPTAGKPKPGDGKLNLSSMEIRIEPRAEWKQIFNEAWRYNRDFFFDSGMHGLDWKASKKHYEAMLPEVVFRSDLNYVIGEMVGDLGVGHHGVFGGDMPQSESVPVGLLGADFEVVDGRYRIKKIYSGLNWNPDLRAPLREPGVNVKEGDYILRVNGQELRYPTNIYSLFANTVKKQTLLHVNSEPNIEGARTVTVVPIQNEYNLRNRAWIHGNRKKVEKLSGGRIGYMYIPNTMQPGQRSFDRYFFSQLDKEGLIIDERYNGGGQIADYIIDFLGRPLTNYITQRHGKKYHIPFLAMFGPKVMLINQYAGSGGDILPFLFSEQKIGTLIGKRTWGGLVAGSGPPGPLMDGGGVASPGMAFLSKNGKWMVENVGVPPDIDITNHPGDVIKGIDAQLEKAVQVALEEIKKNPAKTVKIPEYPDKTIKKR